MQKNPDAANSGAPIVLIVNSEPSVCEFLRDVLADDGMWAKTCYEDAGNPALPGLEDADCAILGVAGVEPDGLAWQQACNARGVATVFVTRSHSVSDCCRALKAGASDFLSLPCAPHHLLSAVHHAIASGRRLRLQREKEERLRYRLSLLTPREREVFVLVASGLLNKQVAQYLGISEITVQIHRGRVMKKMAAASFAALVRMAKDLDLPVVESPRMIAGRRFDTDCVKSYVAH